jgi:hypothetical protein
MQIACLHTAESNIVVFETAARALGIPLDVLRHEVRDDPPSTSLETAPVRLQRRLPRGRQPI